MVEAIDDVEEIARKADRLAAEPGQEFVMGMGKTDTGITDDFMHLDGGGADPAELRA